MTIAIDPEVGVEVATDAVQRAVKAGADAATVQHVYSEQFEVNFDSSDVSLVRTTVGDNVVPTVYVGTRKGSTAITGRSHDDVDRGIADALGAARAGQDDPANVIPTDPADPAESKGPSEPDRDAMVDSALRHIARMRDEYPNLRTDRSSYRFVSSWNSYANSAGRVQHARRGMYQVSVVVTGRDAARSVSTSFNYVTQVGAEPFTDFLDIPIVRTLADDTVASFDAQPIPETFEGDVIFTPHVMGTVAGTVVGALSGMSLMRKTTPFLESLGSVVAAPSFSLLHRPSAFVAASPFDGEGFPNADLDIIRDGELKSFLVNWYFSHKLGRPMTTGQSDLVVSPGNTALDDIIAGTERGILLGRYSGGMPSQNLDFSGVAKNSFYISDGKIRHPLVETMVAGNFRTVLESIKAISAETIDFGYSCYPWVASGPVTISTK